MSYAASILGYRSSGDPLANTLQGLVDMESRPTAAQLRARQQAVTYTPPRDDVNTARIGAAVVLIGVAARRGSNSAAGRRGGRSNELRNNDPRARIRGVGRSDR